MSGSDASTSTLLVPPPRTARAASAAVRMSSRMSPAAINPFPIVFLLLYLFLFFCIALPLTGIIPHLHKKGAGMCDNWYRHAGVSHPDRPFPSALSVCFLIRPPDYSSTL